MTPTRIAPTRHLPLSRVAIRRTVLGLGSGAALLAAFGLGLSHGTITDAHSSVANYQTSAGAIAYVPPTMAPQQADQGGVAPSGAGPTGVVDTTPVEIEYSTLSMTRANISQWAIPPNLHAYRLYTGGAYPAGQCTAYAWYKDQRLTGLGNAGQWYNNAGRFARGSTPRANSTVVFAPGEQGAGSLGHVAHVEEVYSNGWFLISESNFAFNGGGLGIVSFRYAHTTGGTHFIYR